jgi:hypothetical protein
MRVPVDATGYAEPRRFRQRSSLRFWRLKSSCPAQVVGSSSSGIGAIQMRVRPSQRCAKMLWPHFRHFGMRFMTLLHVRGAGHVARVEQGSAHAVTGWRTARQARPHGKVGAASLDGVCDNLSGGDVMVLVRSIGWPASRAGLLSHHQES